MCANDATITIRLGDDLFNRPVNQWRTEGGVWGVQTPPPEILKALQNRAKLNPIVKT